MRIKLIGVFIFFIVTTTKGQTTVTLDSVLATALKNHPAILQSQTEILAQQQFKKSSFNLPNPEFAIETPAKDFGWNVSQSLDNPLVYLSETKLNNQNILLSKQQLLLTKTEVTFTVRNSYLQLQFQIATLKELNLQDSLYHSLSNANDEKYSKGEIGLLEKLNASNGYQSKHTELIKAKTDFENAQQQLLLITGLKISSPMPSDSLVKYNIPVSIIGDTSYNNSNPWLQYSTHKTAVAMQNWKLEKTKLLPGFKGTYFNSNGNTGVTPSRFDIGITVPLWFWTYSGKIKAAKYQWQSSNYELATTQLNINSQWQQSIAEFKKASASLQYYEASAIPQANSIIDAATRSYTAGEISYIEFLQNLNTAFETKLNYLSAVSDYNNSINQLLKIKGQ